MRRRRLWQWRHSGDYMGLRQLIRMRASPPPHRYIKVAYIYIMWFKSPRVLCVATVVVGLFDFYYYFRLFSFYYYYYFFFNCSTPPHQRKTVVSTRTHVIHEMTCAQLKYLTNYYYINVYS